MAELSREQIEARIALLDGDAIMLDNPFTRAELLAVYRMALTALSDDSVRVPRDLLDRCIEKSSSNAPNYEAIQALRKWLAASEREAG
jgi:hypothetical protein